MRIEKRKPVFLERLSWFLIGFSSLGAAFILVDPVITFATEGGTIIKIGGDGFAEQMKGSVITLILIGGFTAVINFWIGMSNQGAKAQENVNAIAQAAAPSAAAAVAAATGVPAPTPAAPIVAENVDVIATTATLTEKETP